MPRLGLAINEKFDNRPKAPKPDPYGRRVRAVEGVQIVGEREKTPIVTSLYAKAVMTLAFLATLTTLLALVRLFNFRH